MTRIEKGQPAKQEIEKLKAQVVNEVRRVRRKRLPLLPILSLLLLASLAVFVSWLIAASGFMEVPFVSRYAYRAAPEPTREVAAGEPLETVIVEAVNDLLPDRLQAGGGQLLDRSFDITLEESAFTASLRAALEQDANTLFDAGGAQVAIVEGQGLEIFLPFAHSDLKTALIILVNLRVQDGRLAFDLPLVQLGQLTMPAWISEFVIAAPLEQGISAFEGELQRMITITDIQTEQGFLYLLAELQVEVLPSPDTD